MSIELTPTEQLLAAGIKQQREQLQQKDARIAELETLVQQANSRLRAAGFVYDANGNRI